MQCHPAQKTTQTYTTLLFYSIQIVTVHVTITTMHMKKCGNSLRLKCLVHTPWFAIGCHLKHRDRHSDAQTMADTRVIFSQFVYRNSVDNTVVENSSIFSLIQMCSIWLPLNAALRRPNFWASNTVNLSLMHHQFSTLVSGSRPWSWLGTTEAQYNKTAMATLASRPHCQLN